jgi:hypothetical protein
MGKSTEVLIQSPADDKVFPQSLTFSNFRQRTLKTLSHE